MDKVNTRVDIVERDKDILVHVEVFERREYPLVPLIVVETKDIISYLEEENVQFGALVDHGSANNRRNHNRKGTWVFKKKTLDKSPKKVTLKKEKSVPPKPARKKRTRSSTKKVSTED